MQMELPCMSEMIQIEAYMKQRLAGVFQAKLKAGDSGADGNIIRVLRNNSEACWNDVWQYGIYWEDMEGEGTMRNEWNTWNQSRKW